jgi:hypothetical protein
MSHPAETDLSDSPIFWFARLDLAVERGDHEAAAEAQRQLARLGILVRYGRPRPTPRKAVADAR